MFSKQVVIQNPSGLHARPASMLTRFAKGFDEQILLKHGTVEADPKSIISLLSSGIKAGTAVTVEVTGANADETGEKLVGFLQNLNEQEDACGASDI